MASENDPMDGDPVLNDDPEYYDDDDEEIESIDINAIPQIARLQKALSDQLNRELGKIDLELREKSDLLKKQKTERENVGAVLYTTQQDLAKLQMQLEKTHDNFNIINKIRQQVDEELLVAQDKYRQRKNDVEDQRWKVESSQAELDKLNSMLKHVETNLEKVSSDIAVTRRVTYKAEDDVSKLETEKREQDLLIDHLQQTINRLREQVGLFEAQIRAQSAESTAARETLDEATQEMEAIQFEMKQLMQNWKSSLIGLQRKDEALRAAEDALRGQREEQRALETEIQGYKSNIRQLQEMHEKLTSVLEKHRADSNYLEQQIRQNKEKQDRLQNQCALLKKNLESVDGRLTLAQQERKKLEEEVSIVDKQLQSEQNERHRVEALIMHNLNEQTTVKKSSQNTAKNAEQTRKKIHEAEMQAAQLENELARIRVDALNTQAHNDGLKQNLQELVAELNDKKMLIERYEMDIERRNNEIEKKQSAVDLLNRKYDSLTANMVDENFGPLEATIHNLGKAIKTKEVEITDLQREWIRTQTELVSVQNRASDLNHQIQELKSTQAILTHKRMRQQNSLTSLESEMKELDNGMKVMHEDMKRLNNLIAENRELKERLNDANFNAESDFVKRLRELEVEAVRMEQVVEATLNEKTRALEEIVEVERQIMLWERKIQLEKETQAALDPDVGKDITDSMAKEIHRMKLRKSQLKRRQEELVRFIEQAVQKRDKIFEEGRLQSMRTKPVKKRLGAKTTVVSHSIASRTETQGSIRREINELTRRIKAVEGETRVAESRIQELEQARAEMGQELEDTNNECDALRKQERDLDAFISQSKIDKLKNFDNILQLQKMAELYNNAVGGKLKTVAKEDREKVSAKNIKLQETVSKLVDEFPDMHMELHRVQILLENK